MTEYPGKRALNPRTAAWRRYRCDRWKGYDIDPEQYAETRKVFMSGYRAALKEKERNMKLKNIRIVSRGPLEEKTVNGMTFVDYPSFGKGVQVIAVLEDEPGVNVVQQEIDITKDVESIDWVAKPDAVPTVSIRVVAPELDVYGVVEAAQLEPKEKVLRAISREEQKEREGLPRHNFGPRFQIEDGSNHSTSCSTFEEAWKRAWMMVSAEELSLRCPPCPASLEGANRLLEKRRRATNEIVGSTMTWIEPVRIQEWIEGEWVG